MPLQTKAMNGEPLLESVRLEYDLLDKLTLLKLPNGLVGVNCKTGLVDVITEPNKPAITMKLGKLLFKLGKEQQEILTICTKLSTLKAMYDAKLYFTTTSEEAIEVYEKGPRSCMKGMQAVAVYATDDVAVAYLKTVEDEIIARAVVCNNPEIGLTYYTLYGFKEPLEELLIKAGYVSDSSNLEGCTLKRIEEDRLILMPYLDGCTQVDVHDDYIEVTDGGEYSAQSTSGYLAAGTCDECGDVIERDDDMYWSAWLEMNMCEHCYLEVHRKINGDWYNVEDDTIVELYDGEYILRDDAVYIEYRNDYYDANDCVYNSYTEEYQLRDDLDI